MPDSSTLGTAIVAISNLITLSIASGLIFVVLIQPKRDQTNNLFAFFCFCLGLWGLTHLMNAVAGMRFGIQPQSLLNLLATALGLTAFSFFMFVVRFAKADGRMARYLMRLLPVALIFGLVVVWSGRAFDSTESTVANLTPLGYIMIGVLLVYVLAGLWSILNSRDKQVHLLRIPAVLLAIAFATNGVGDLARTPIDTLLATVVAIWVGWIVMYFQLFNPLKELNHEMSVANRDLRQVVSDLASEKGKTEKLNQELQVANRYKTEFLATMSHELRTPLNSIVGYSELLQDGIYGQLNEKQLDRLEKIHRNGKALLDLITDILDMTKIEAGRLELTTSVFGLRGIVDEVVTLLKPECDAKGLALETQLPEDLFHLIGDQQRIHQILANLVSNAIKFTPQGKVSIEGCNVTIRNGISSTFQLPLIGWLRDGDWVIFSVHDTGIGIASEDQGRVFDAFWQVDRSSTREFAGTGMGLAITRKLVELHEGTIWIKSALGQGSTFFVALPARRNTDLPILANNDATAEKLSLPSQPE